MDPHDEKVVIAGQLDQLRRRMRGVVAHDLRSGAELSRRGARAGEYRLGMLVAERRHGSRAGALLPGQRGVGERRVRSSEHRRLSCGLEARAAAVDTAEDRREDRTRD